MYSLSFIRASDTFGTIEKPIRAPYVRKTFTLDNMPQAANLILTCTGFYRLFVNGHECTPSRLAPCITNPDDLLFYDTVDVSPYLKCGKNALGFLLGNGISNEPGGFIWQFDKARFRSSPKLAVSFESDALCFEADESFVTSPSPILFDDLRCGEFYDARLETDHWNEPDFDDGAWRPMKNCEPPRGECTANDTDPICVMRELTAVRVMNGGTAKEILHCMDDRAKAVTETAFYRGEEDETGVVYEFAENTSCVPKLKIRGQRGQKIVIQCAEYVSEDGLVSYESNNMYYPRGLCQRDVYICRGGEDEEVYVPSFTYHGAHCFLVMGLRPEQVKEDTVTMLVTHSELAPRGGFACSDGVMSRLYAAAVASDMANFVYFPTDCPHREKNGWTGDAAVSAEHMTQLYDVTRSFRQWMKQIRAAQRPDGCIPAIIPTSGWGYREWCGPAWDRVLTELPYQTYRYRGDLTLFDECADSILRYLYYIANKRGEGGLLWEGLGDWCPAGREGAANYLCPTEVSATASVMDMCRKAKEMFNARGKTNERDYVGALYDSLRTAFRARMVDFSAFTVKGSCQTAQALAIEVGVFDAAEEACAYRRLLELIHLSDDHIDGGMLGLRVVFRLLARHGDAALALRMITRTDAPSYAVWTEKLGRVSLCETFSADPYPHSSLNHHFFGDIAGFFLTHIAGLDVNPNGDDAAFVRISPAFVPGLERAEGWYDTVRGRVSVKWEKQTDVIRLTVTAAENVRTLVELPTRYALHGENDVLNGRYLFIPESGRTYTVRAK